MSGRLPVNGDKRNETVIVRSQYVGCRMGGIQSGLSVDDVPVGNTEKVDTLLNGDEAPVEFLNRVLLGKDFPAHPYGDDTELILTKEWAQTYAAGVNEVPGFFYMKGHENIQAGWNQERAIAAGYVVGAKVMKDKETGSEALFIRNYLLPSDLREQTMKEIRAGLLSTSTSDKQTQTLEVEDGKYTWFSVKSLGDRSNALVEHDMTGSQAHIVAANFKQGKTGGDAEKNNKETYMSEQIENNREVYLRLKNQLDAGKLSVSDLESGLGIEVLTATKRADLKRLFDAESALGCTVEQFIQQKKDSDSKAFEALRDAALSKAFSQEPVREAALELFALESGTQEQIDGEIERLSSLKAIQTVQGAIAGSVNHTPGAQADVSSNSNSVTEA